MFVIFIENLKRCSTSHFLNMFVRRMRARALCIDISY